MKSFAGKAGMSFAPILIEIAVEPREARDAPALRAALAELAAADPTCEVGLDEGTGQVLLGGRDDAHLDALCAALRGRLPLRLGASRVVYRETIERRIEMDTTHKKARDGGFEFARVKLAFAPAAEWRFVGPKAGGLPEAFVAGIEAALARGRRAGMLAGYPVVGIEATLLDGAWHGSETSPAAVEAATLTAFRLAQREVGVLMEPIMEIALTVPAAYAGTARDDLLVRRGTLARRRAHADGTVTLEGTVPFANVLGYRTSVAAMTKGSGTVGLVFSHFEPMPRPDPTDFPGAMAMRA